MQILYSQVFFIMQMIKSKSEMIYFMYILWQFHGYIEDTIVR